MEPELRSTWDEMLGPRFPSLLNEGVKQDTGIIVWLLFLGNNQNIANILTFLLVEFLENTNVVSTTQKNCSCCSVVLFILVVVFL